MFGNSEGWIEKTVVDKTFKINKDAKLVIDHEFGNVKCSNWDKDEIKVLVTIRVKTDDNNKANKIIEKVTVDVKGNSSKVEAVCQLNQKYQKDKDIKVSIDFDIKMPKTVSLEMDNSFGSAYIENIEGPANISSKYGNLEVEYLGNAENQIEIEFGKGEIKHLTDGDIEISYSNFEIGEANNITVETEYSDLKINNVKRLSIEVEGGNCEIENVEHIDIESSFANIEIDKLTGSLISESEYGNLTANYINSGFKNVSIDNSYGAVELAFDSKASYKIEAEGVFCKIAYPEENAKVSYRNESVGSTKIKGVIGNNAAPASSVSIVSEYGAVSLSLK